MWETWPSVPAAAIGVYVAWKWAGIVSGNITWGDKVGVCLVNILSHIVATDALINKRAQRALGRSPEENVKGHSGAIYRGPLMWSTKYW